MKETTAQEPRNLLEMNIKLLKEYESIVSCTNLKIQHLQNDKYTMWVEPQWCKKPLWFNGIYLQ
jgi:hypothetical protein